MTLKPCWLCGAQAIENVKHNTVTCLNQSGDKPCGVMVVGDEHTSAHDRWNA